jgi:DNA-binding beta-propeller fold protein YncE
MTQGMRSRDTSIRVGGERFNYAIHEQWEQLPDGWSFVEVAGVATDSRDRVYVFNRGEHPVIVFERDGRFLGSWGEGQFQRPHGITIGPDDAVYCTDDRDHTVRKFTTDGKLLMTLGSSGRPSDTGVQGIDYRTIKRCGPPFNLPTNLAIAPDGNLYVTDGYGNARVHCFAPDGRLMFSWGEPGTGPGQFNLPHGIAIARDGTVYVADRENSRVQLFSPRGEFVAEWTDVGRPMQVFVERRDGAEHVFVAETGFRAGMFPWAVAPGPNPPGARVSVFTIGGELVARWGEGEDPCAPGNFFAPHDLWIDSRGDLYVGEVTMSAGGNRGVVPPTCHSLQKFVREASNKPPRVSGPRR